MDHPGWMLVGLGLLLALAGLLWLAMSSVPWLGRLPGDIVIEREHFRFYFPLATSLLLSLLLTGLLWLLRQFSR
jgi:hypothetical protein